MLNQNIKIKKMGGEISFFIFFIISFCFSVYLLFAGHSFPARALNQIDELKNEIELKNQEIKLLEAKTKEYKTTISKSQKDQTTLKKRLKSLSDSIKNLDLEIKLTGKKIEKLNFEISQLNIEIEEQKNKIAEKKKAVSLLVQNIYKLNAKNILAVLIQSDNLSDAYNKTQYNIKLNDLLIKRLKNLKELKQEIETQKINEETKKINLEDLKTELNDKKEINKNEEKDKNFLLIKTQNQEKKYQNLLVDIEKTSKEVQDELEEIEEKLRLAIDPKSLPPEKKGFFEWPTQGILSSNFGERMDPMGLGQKFHNGIDIANNTGALIKSPYNGKVLAIGDSDKFCWKGAYGKWIVIDHENNLATMYAHLSLIKVSPSQQIKKNDVIGLMGNTGHSTGSHLHFTIYDQRTLDIHQSRVCGILPYGGAIDPLKYL